MNLTDHLSSAIETEANVLAFVLPDSAEKIEKLSALHHEAVTKKTAEISRVKSSLRRTISALDKEIERLQAEKTAAKTGADAVIAQNQKIIAASQAFIKVLEG